MVGSETASNAGPGWHGLRDSASLGNLPALPVGVHRLGPELVKQPTTPLLLQSSAHGMAEFT
jgi:hypothetical protein